MPENTDISFLNS